MSGEICYLKSFSLGHVKTRTRLTLLRNVPGHRTDEITPGYREIRRQQVVKRSVLVEASAGQVFATCRRGDEFLPGQDGHAVSHQGSEIVPARRATPTG